MDPINYLGLSPTENPLAAASQGMQIGAAIRNNQLQAQMQDIQMQRLKQYQVDAQQAMKTGDPRAFAALVLKYPEQREAAKQAWGQLSDADQKQEGDTMRQSYAALLAGNPDAAQKVVQDAIEARKNSGLDTSHYDNALSLLQQNPDQAKNYIGLILSHISDPQKFAEHFGKLGDEARNDLLFPSKQKKETADASKAESEATIAGEKAKVAAQDVLLELQQKGWNVKKIQSDITNDKERTRLEAMKVAYMKSDNDLKRQELGIKIRDAEDAFAQKIRDRAADVDKGRSNIDNMLDKIEQVKAHPALNDVVGSIEGKSWYPNMLAAAARGPIFGTSGDDRADAIHLVETLGSQSFLAQIPAIKGTGSLSNAEGDKLQTSLTNLSRAQSEKQFRANLDEARRILLKTRGVIEKQYGATPNNPDTPSVKSTRPPLDSFMTGQ